jgi:hypothetical protein
MVDPDSLGNAGPDPDSLEMPVPYPDSLEMLDPYPDSREMLDPDSLEMRIRIRIHLKCWIRIYLKKILDPDSDPQHALLSFDKFYR